MYALSIRQPWLYAIMYLGKTVENRTWLPPQRAVGKQIALHASKYDNARYLEESLSIITEDEKTKQRVKDAIKATYGKVLAVTTLVGAYALVLNQICQVSGHPTPKHVNSAYAQGPACWCLDNTQILESPVCTKGHLGLFILSEQDENEVLQQVYPIGRQTMEI